MSSTLALTALSLGLLLPRLLTAEVSFSRHIAPILIDQCLECHRPEKAKGAYRLDHFRILLQPGDSEQPPIVPGRPDQSELLRLILTPHEDDRMPKKGDPLPAHQQDLLRQWITQGAKLDTPDPLQPLTALVPPRPRPRAPATYPRPLPITALALSPDGRTLAVSGWYEVTLWDAHTGQLRTRIPDLPEKITALAWIGTRPHLAIAGGSPMRSGELWLADLTTPTPAIRRLLTTPDTLLALAVTPSGTHLATAGSDNRVHLLALPEGRTLWTVEPHADWVTALAFSPDQKHLATAARDRTARLLDVTTGRIHATHTGHTVPVTAITFSPDGKEILSGDAEGQIRRWLPTGEGKKDTTLRPTRQAITSLAFAQQHLLAALADGRVLTLDRTTRKPTRTLHTYADRVNQLQVLTPPGQPTLVITGAHDGQIRIWHQPAAQDILRLTAAPGLAQPLITPPPPPPPPPAPAPTPAPASPPPPSKP